MFTNIREARWKGVKTAHRRATTVRPGSHHPVAVSPTTVRDVTNTTAVAFGGDEPAPSPDTRSRNSQQQQQNRMDLLEIDDDYEERRTEYSFVEGVEG